MIFLTVGTQFPFDRLVRAVDRMIDEGVISETLFAQIGESTYKPRNFNSVASLGKKMFDERLKQASSIISHAGIGTITIALDNHKPLLVMPRLKKYGEVVNDHQLAIAKKFEQLGHILVAYRQEELGDKLVALKSFVPKPRKVQLKPLTDRIAYFLKTLSEGRKEC